MNEELELACEVPLSDWAALGGIASRQVPDSDLRALERSQMPWWLFEAFHTDEMRRVHFQQTMEAEERANTKQREADDLEFDLWEFKRRHRLP